MELTKNSSIFAAVLYKQYLKKLKDTGDIDFATLFKNDFHIEIDELSDWSKSLVNFSIKELHRANLLSENILGEITINSNFISLMENRFDKKTETVSQFIKDLIIGIASNISIPFQF